MSFRRLDFSRSYPEQAPYALLDRIITRRLIASERRQNPSSTVGETAHSVTAQRQSEVFQTLQQLKTQEFFPDERMMLITQQLQENLVGHLPQLKNLSVVLLGSSANPTGRIQEAVRGQKRTPHDLDWGIVYDPPPTLTEDTLAREQVQDIARNFVPHLGRQHELPDLQSCDTFNGASFYAYHLNSLDQARQLLATTNPFGLASQALLYFPPSFPHNANLPDQRYFLQALDELAILNPNKHAMITASIQAEWKTIRAPIIKVDDVEMTTPRDEYLLLQLLISLINSDIFTHHMRERLLPEPLPNSRSVRALRLLNIRNAYTNQMKKRSATR